MFGKRFSISASTLAVAGACSVMLSSSVVIAQGYYQQTGFPQYRRPQISGLSAAATRPPAFTDTAADATAMSPDSWGESAINNPYAGYQNSSNASGRIMPNPFVTRAIGSTAPIESTTPGANPNPASATVQPPAEAVSILSPTPAEPSEGALTNTDYSRGPDQPEVPEHTENSETPERPERYADASFEAGKDLPLTDPSAQPKIGGPGNDQTLRGLGEITIDAPPQRALEASTEQTTGSFEGLLSPETADSKPAVARPPAAAPETLSVQPLPPTPQSSAPVAPPQSAPASASAALPSTSQPFTSQPFSSQPFRSQVVETRLGYPVFTPTQDEPAYRLDGAQTDPAFSAPAVAAPSGGLIGNELGFGYPQIGQTYLPVPTQSYGYGQQSFGMPTYRPNVAFRSGMPTTRNHTIFDQGQSFDHENKKKEFPPFSEIIAQGKFFGALEVAFLKPHFLGNTGFSLDGPTFSESIPFDFDNETAPRARFGFESKYGPGFELNYFTLNANSEALSRAFNGVSEVTTIASITGPNRFTQLSADAIGETLVANHSFEIETFGFNVFKDIAFKVSRIGGRFGFTYANIAQSLEASVIDGGGNVLDSLDNTTDFRGLGPKLGIDYYRPVGHTPLEFVTSFTGLGLFGRRDQFVNNTAGLVERRFGADEFIAMLDLTSGVQFRKTIAENRTWFARLAFVHQTWLGGGTAVDPTGDFGLQGVTFAVGYNR